MRRQVRVVGNFTSASITVESIRTAAATLERVASTIKQRVNSFTVSAPIRRVSLRTVDSSAPLESAIRQNRRR